MAKALPVLKGYKKLLLEYIENARIGDKYFLYLKK